MKLVQSLLVKPEITSIPNGRRSTPGTEPVRTWNLTSADRLTLEKGYTLDTCWIFSNSIPTEVIKDSLAKLLAEYRVFAGRYDEWNKCVIMNDAGITLQVCEDMIYDVAQAIDEHHTEEFAKRFVDPSSSIVGYRLLNAPLMTVRLSYLRDGGCVLGVEATHGLCDGETFYTMMDRWAKLARGMDTACTAVFDQSQVPFETSRRTYQQCKQEANEQGWDWISIPPAGIRMAHLLAGGVTLHHLLRTRPFHVSNKALKCMKYAAELDCKMSGRKLAQGVLTTNEVLSSFLSQVLARAFDFKDSTPCGHSTMFNWRGRLSGLSPNFAGNASSAISTGKFFAGSPLGEIASRINQGLDAFKNDPVMVDAHVKLFFDCHDVGLIAHMADPRTLPYLSTKPTTTVTNNFARYPIYEVDFGFGKPVHVAPHHCGDQALLWPSANGDGVEVYFQGSTAQLIHGFTDEERVWFETELNKYENVFNEEAIREWFATRIAPMKKEMKLIVNSTMSPVMVNRKPQSPKSLPQRVTSFITEGIILPMLALAES